MSLAKTVQPPILSGERQALLDKLTAAEPQPGRPLIYVLQGLGGMGRTTLIEKLLKRLRDEGRMALHAKLDRYRTTAVADGEGSAAERELLAKQQYLSNYRRILEDLAAPLPGAKKYTAKAHKLARGVQSESEADVAKDELRDAFLDELAGSVGVPLVLLLDDYSAVAGSELGRWLEDLFDRAAARRPVLAVLVTTGSLDERNRLPRSAVIVELQPFAPEDVASRLEAATAGVPLADDWPASVYHWCRGYPAAVDLAAEVARDSPQRPGVLAGDQPPAVLKHRTTSVFKNLMDSIENDAERAALEVASVVRRFDAKLLGSLVEELAPAELEPAALEHRLQRYPFVEADHPRDPSKYRVLPFARHLAALELDVSRLAEIRTLAGYFYLEELSSGDGGYRSWEELEGVKHEEAVRDFVHFANAFLDRAEARRWLAAAYFRAFWWWGWYLESPLCLHQLDEMERTQPEAEDAEFFCALRLFHVSYPPYFDSFKGRVRGDWKAVADALRDIRQLIGPAREGMHDNEYGFRAIPDVFLAQSLRRLRPDDPDIAARYGAARKGFGKSEKYKWSVPWVDYDEADWRLERGKLDDAVGLARAGLDSATGVDDPEELDREVIANLHRVLGDVAFESGRYALAFGHYGSALVYAWEFQALPKIGDDYTRAFYEEISIRVGNRLEELGAQEAEEAKRLLRELWAPYFAEVDDPDEGGLYPRVPARGDLDRSSDYVRRVRDLGAVIKQCAGDVVQDLERRSFGGMVRHAFRRDS
jgi:hypothetical protein